ncbi:unnamed protein product, partial [Tenebrio molitor]
MAPKRKHVTVTLKQKSEILKKIDSGQTGKNLASEYNVGASTISNIRRNRQNIKRFIEHCYSGPGSSDHLVLQRLREN